jgi:hypothetical protein
MVADENVGRYGNELRSNKGTNWAGVVLGLLLQQGGSRLLL